MFGSPNRAAPPGHRQTLVWAKPPNAGLFGSFGGWRRDWEAIYLVGAWPAVPAQRSGVIRSQATNLATYTQRGHPHSKPLDLMETLIATCPKGVIADPFSGSGTTLVAAKLQGRPAIGVEIEEKYCEIAARRLAQEALPVLQWRPPISRTSAAGPHVIPRQREPETVEVTEDQLAIFDYPTTGLSR